MDEHRMDFEIREKLKLCKREDVPDVVKGKVDTILANLPSQKKRIQRLPISLAACFTLIFILLCILNIPILAETMKKIPVIGSVFQFIGDRGLKQASEKGITVHDLVPVSDKGIKVSITDILYDGTRISVGYTVELEDEENDDQLKRLFKVSYYIDGQLYETGEGAQWENIDNKKYACILNIDAPQNVQDEFKFSINFKTVNGVMGKWNFENIVIKRQSDKLNTRVFSPMISGKFLDQCLTVSKVILTDATTRIELVGEEPIPQYFDWCLQDDNGNFINQQGGNMTFEDGKPYIQVLFDPVRHETEYFTVMATLKLSQSNHDSSFTADLGKDELLIKDGENGNKVVKKLYEVRIPLSKDSLHTVGQ